MLIPWVIWSYLNRWCNAQKEKEEEDGRESKTWGMKRHAAAGKTSVWAEWSRENSWTVIILLPSPQDEMRKPLSFSKQTHLTVTQMLEAEKKEGGGRRRRKHEDPENWATRQQQVSKRKTHSNCNDDDDNERPDGDDSWWWCVRVFRFLAGGWGLRERKESRTNAWQRQPTFCCCCSWNRGGKKHSLAGLGTQRSAGRTAVKNKGSRESAENNGES